MGEKNKKVVRAAGGVVYRRAADGPEVLVIHRPRYDDWTLPKGKLDPGETAEEAAIREVEEETGYRAVIESPAGSVRYRDRHGRPKGVDYWFMTVDGGEFSQNDEVDEIRWLSPKEAEKILTFERDQALVRRLAGHAGL